jgi:DNA-binding IclR family transcriptional regulator
MPLPAGASGLVILAFVPRPAAAAAMAGSGLADEDERQLRADLARVRRDGYLASEVDWPGARAPGGTALATLAAPVFGSSGIAGAIAVVGPADRWGREEMDRAAASVRLECAALSAALGSLPPLD